MANLLALHTVVQPCAAICSSPVVQPCLHTVVHPSAAALGLYMPPVTFAGVPAVRLSLPGTAVCVLATTLSQLHPAYAWQVALQPALLETGLNAGRPTCHHGQLDNKQCLSAGCRLRAEGLSKYRQAQVCAKHLQQPGQCSLDQVVMTLKVHQQQPDVQQQLAAQPAKLCSGHVGGLGPLLCAVADCGC